MVPSMRSFCYRCRRPVENCLCALVQPMDCDIKLVVLMHPHERKKVKNGTGRLAALSFRNAEIIEGISFDADKRVAALLADQQYIPYILYPGPGARDLSKGELDKTAFASPEFAGRTLLVFVVDATWPLAKKMMRESRILQTLPRLMFTPSHKSRWIIKRQPDELCLSTIEAVHELMSALAASGICRYERPGQLLAAFEAMQSFQIACTNDPDRPSRHGAPPENTAGTDPGNSKSTPYTRRRRPPSKKTRALLWREQDTEEQE